MPSRLLAVFLLPAAGFSQKVPDREALALTSTPSGQIISGGAGGAWVAQSNSRGGAERFRVHLGADPRDRILAVAAGPDGVVYAAGEVTVNGRARGIVAGIAANGAVLSKHSFPGPMRAVAVASDGAVYAAGDEQLVKLGGWTRPVPGPVNSLAIDRAGRLFAAGVKDSTVETGSHGTDGYVARLSADAETWEPILVLGGTGGADEVRAILADPAGDAIYAVGSTDSGDFPVRKAFQQEFHGTRDAFAAKLRFDGEPLIEWATYIGGRGDDAALALAMDGSGGLTAVGRTMSPDFPHAGEWNGSEDGFLVVLSRDGAFRKAVYSGTTGAEHLTAVTAASDGSIHLARSKGSGAPGAQIGPLSGLGTTLTLTTIPATPIALGTQPVLRATVNPALATGKVTFYDGESVLGSATLAAGVADLAVTFLTPGTRTLRARYNGDPTYDPSTGSAVVNITAVPGGSFHPALSSPIPLFGGVAASVPGDFNRDGRVDIAVADTGGSVGIYQGDGTGRFAFASFLTVGTLPSALAVSDFNEDGIPDLAYVDRTANAVNILVGDGAFNFTAPGTPFATGTSPSAIVVGDFNSDGIADFAVANSGSNNVSIARGTGAGSYAPGGTIAVCNQPTGIVQGLFDGFAGVDLAVVCQGSSTLQVVSGSPGGTFSPPGGALPTINVPLALATFDFNLDGVLDLVMTHPADNTVRVWRGNAGGGFALPGTTYPAGNTPTALSIGDFNADGRTDVAVANQGGRRVTVLTSDAFGGLTPLAAGPFRSGDGSIGVSSADIDRDGRSDLIVTNSISPYVDVLVGRVPASVSILTIAPVSANLGSAVTITASVTPSTATGTVTFYDGARPLGTATITGPGNASLTTIMIAAGARKIRAVYGGSATHAIAVSAPTNYTVSAGAATGFGSPTNVTLPNVTGPSFALGDFDGDGKVDLVTTSAASALVLLRGNGTGGFILPATTIATPLTPAGVTAVDFNRDGRLDIVYADSIEVWLVPGNGNGTFGAPAVLFGNDGFLMLESSDFNMDGAPDVVYHTGASVFIVDGRGGGYGAFPLAFTSSVEPADFNNDGFPDLLAAMSNAPAQTVAVGNGDISFAATQPPASGPFTQRFATAADFNGDGNPDAAGGEIGGNQVAVQPGLGNGNLGPAVNVPTGAGPLTGVAGDFNGDGRQDLAIANGGTNTITIALGNGNGTFQAPNSIVVGAQPSRIGVADLNGDGRSDLIVSYASSTNITVILGTAAAGATVTVATPPGNTPFSLSTQNVSLSARVTVGPNPVGAGSVNFRLQRGVTTIGTPVNGVLIDGTGTAQTSYTIPAALTLGAVTVVADYVPGPGLLASSDATKTFNIVPGPPVSVNATGGANQSTPVTTAFVNPLQATVRDAGSNPVPGILVTFTAPGTGASAVFPNGNTATTDANGNAAVPVLANVIAGSYTVNATVAGVGGPAGFPLTNNPGAPASITVTGGTPQTAGIGTDFAVPLQVAVRDANSNPARDILVTFSAPAAGASATFPGGSTTTTDVNGVAQVTARANSLTGSYAVNASVSGVGTPATFALTNAATVITVQTNPTGIQFTVDGVNYTSPQTFSWIAGSTHTIATANPTPGPTQRQIWVNWSNSGAISQTVTAPAASTTYTANFKTQYLLSLASSPTNGGTASATPGSADGFHDSGTVVSIGAAAASGFVFDSFSGDLTGTTQPQNITMSAARSVTAKFLQSSVSTTTLLNQPSPVPFSISAQTIGLSASVTSSNGSPTGSILYTVRRGSTVIGTPVTAAVGAVASYPIPAGLTLGALTATAEYQGTQVFQPSTDSKSFSVAAGPPALMSTTGGNGQSTGIGSAFANPLQVTVTDAGNNPVPGVLVTFSAPANGASAVFPSGNTATTNANGAATAPVSANLTAGSYTVTATVNSIFANFSLTNTGAQFIVNTNPAGLPFTVDGVTYNQAQTFTWAQGSQHTLSTANPAPGSSQRTVFASWSNGGAISQTITAPSVSTTYTANFRIQYLLTLGRSPSNGGVISASPSSNDGFYNAGSVVDVAANPLGGWTFNGFTGDATTTSNPVSITMSAPRSITANFSIPTPGGPSGGGITPPPPPPPPASSQSNLGPVPDNPPPARTGVPFDYNVCPDIAGAPPLPNLSFVYTAPASLPPGMSISPSGRLTGTPENPGTYNFDVPGRWVFSSNQTTTVYTFVCRVTMVVAGDPGSLSVDSGGASFSFAEESTDSGLRVFRVSNRGNRARSFSVSASTEGGASWLSASGGGTIPPFSSSTFTLRASPSGLQAGVYKGTAVVSGSDGTVERINVGAVMTISAADQNMILSQTGMTFVLEEGSAASVVQNFQILKTATAPLPFTITPSTLSGGDWLRTLISGGTVTGGTPANVGVTVATTGLEPGTYHGLIEVRSSAAANSPQFVGVVLRITPASENPPPFVVPHGLLFVDGRADGAAPQYISVTNTSKKSLSFSVGVNFDGSPAPNWFTTSAPVTTMAPGQTVFVAAARDSSVRLPAGASRAHVTLRFTTGYVRRVDVVAVVPPQTVAASKSNGQLTATGCTPARLIPVFVTLGTGFNATASWPSALEVAVVDDCGDPFAAGTTSVSFSNGDPPLAMLHVGQGRWSGTWQPRSGAQNVVLTATSQSATAATLQGTAQIGGAAATNTSTPTVRNGGVVSAASLGASPVAPGGYISVLGSALATGLSTSPGSPYATDLAGTQVLLGGRRLPLEYASDGRINAIIPYEVTPNITQQLVVRRGTAYSMPEPIVIASVQPAVFTRNQLGTGEVSATVVRDGAEVPVEAANPVSSGDVISIYCAGLGAVSPVVPAGTRTPDEPRSALVKPAVVRIGDSTAEVRFAGLAPGLTGVYVIQAVVPSGVAAGPAVPLTVATDGATSSPVTIAIR